MRGFFTFLWLLACTPAIAVPVTECGVYPNTGLDQTSAIQACINNHRELDFLPGLYIHTGLTGRDDISIGGTGAVLHIITNAVSLNFTGKNGWFLGKGLTLEGTAAPFPAQTDTGQIGVLISGVERFRIDWLTVRNMSGSGIDYSNVPSWWTQAPITSSTFINNYRGIYAHNSGEYLRVSNVGMNRNIMGIDSDNGNQIIDTGWFINNYTSIRFNGESNNGHSLLANLIIDHTWYPLVVRDVDAGLSLSNVQMLCDLSGPIAAPQVHIYNSSGVNIIGGQIAADLIFDGTASAGKPNRNGLNQVSNVHIRQPYVYTTAAPIVRNGATTPSFKNNFTATGQWAYNN